MDPKLILCEKYKRHYLGNIGIIVANTTHLKEQSNDDTYQPVLIQ